MNTKNFIIIGGSSGIGLAIAKQLAEQGHEVYVGSRTAKNIPAMNNVHHFRFGVPADIANAACFLLRYESSWITGQILHVDGGMSSVKLF